MLDAANCLKVRRGALSVPVYFCAQIRVAGSNSFLGRHGRRMGGHRHAKSRNWITDAEALLSAFALVLVLRRF